MYAHLAGASRVILVRGPAGRLRLPREIGVGDVHIDIFELSEPEERVRLVVDSTQGRRGAEEKHYLGHIRALPQLTSRFDLPRLITRYRLEDADTAPADMSAGRIMKPVLAPDHPC
jgi:hypothetical protein